MNAKVVAAIILFAITVVGCVVFISFMGHSNEPNFDTEPIPASEAVILEVKADSVSCNGLTLLIKNVGMAEYLFGSEYVIERQLADGWYQLPYISEDIVWTSIGYILAGNSTQETELDWTGCYGALGPGNYRITKDFSYIHSSGDYDDTEYSISANFSIDFALSRNYY